MLPASVRASVALLGGFFGCAAAQHPTTQPPRPRILLTVAPAIAFISPGSSGVRVRATLRINQPTVEQRCGAEAWSWGEGEAPSLHSEDCNPEELEPWLADAQMVLSKEHIYRAPCECAVVVTLTGSRGVVALADTKVRIIYPGAQVE